MKIKLLTCILILVTAGTQAQQKIKDGTGAPATSLPAAGSILELQSAEAGLRMPQILLTNTSIWAPVAGSGVAVTSPGMSVYNSNPAIISGTGTNGTVYPATGIGEYYWDGFGWVTKNNSTSKGFKLVWAGTSTPNSNYVINAGLQAMNSTESYDGYNAGSGGTYTIPFDAFYTITNANQMRGGGTSAQQISWSMYVFLTPLATGIQETRSISQNGNQGGVTLTYNQTTTAFLHTGDQIKFGAQPCGGGACDNVVYNLKQIDQTISVYQ
jgi:hypothetical protein